MKHIFLFLFCVLAFGLSAQTTQTSFMFEDAVVPAEWVAANGSLSLTKNHYKQGVQSLSWTTTGESVLDVNVRSFSTNNLSTYLQLRSPEITNDTLVVEFLDANNVAKRIARVLVNFNGWNEFNRAYSEYKDKSSFSLVKIRFTLKPTQKTTQRQLFFDDVTFNNSVKNKKFGSMWVLDSDQLAESSRLLKLYTHPKDIPLTSPSEQELAGLTALLERMPREKRTPLALPAARGIAKGLSIVRNEDGSVRGEIIDCTADGLSATLITQYLNVLETLGYRSEQSSSDSILFLNFLDHLLDQGFSKGTNFVISSSNYTDARYICAGLLNIVPYLDDKRKENVLDLVYWLSEHATVYFPEDQYLSEFNSDLIYNYLPHYYGYAILQPDKAVAVRELKALKRYLERHAEVTYGNVDMLKIDGTGFHHWTHYNNYMYAFNTWVNYVNILKGTIFNMGAEGYKGFRKAVMAMYLQANKNIGGTNKHYFANSLAGRNPYAKGGINVQVSLTNLEQLVSTGGTILGTPLDTELAAFYNYCTNSSKFDVDPKDFDGYHQFNYSPLGIARKGNWVVAMRAPTSYFWGAEIYANQNRFGRYQSHGSMEVVYTGGYEHSGIPTTADAGGWDWNIVPGATVVHYKSWTDMSPGKNRTQRFDQKSNGTDFSGALAFGKFGVFATDFVQGDNWGNQVFSPTNLKFKKSIFTFDSLFVSLGTNISASGAYGTDLTTATNLFQEIKSSVFSDLIVDGTVVNEGSSKSYDGTQSHWILTPLKTGYIIPKGNNNISLHFGEQTSPLQTGSDMANPTTTLTAAKAFLDHGKQPSAGKYNFAMVPATNANSLADLSNAIGDNGGSIYKIEAQSESMHAVTHLASQTTGYAFFEPVNNISFGEIVSTTAEHLLMITKDEPLIRRYLAICNPNLRPQSDDRFGFLSQPTTTKIVIKGEWKALIQTEGIKSVTIVGSNTEIEVMLSEGMPEYLTIGDPTQDAIEKTKEPSFVTLSQSATQLVLHFSDLSSDKEIFLMGADGRMINRFRTSDSDFQISKQDLRSGLYLLQVKSGGKMQNLKCIL